MKAQLILVGGRPIPNVLTIIHQQSELIVAICSKESEQSDWPTLEKTIRRLVPRCEIVKKVTDGFYLESIKDACKSELYRSADWIFNITSGTTIMSLGAYEIAKEYKQDASISCWYLDTAKSRAIALTGKQPGTKETEKIFSISVDQYITAYDYTLRLGQNHAHAKYFKQADWIDFARYLGKNPDQIKLLKDVVTEVTKQREKSKKDNRSLPSFYLITQVPDKTYSLFEKAQNIELVSALQHIDGSTIRFTLSEQQYAFLNGTWLELYVWSEAEKLREQDFFTDCQWNQVLLSSNKKEISAPDLQYKDMDVSMIYNAQLVIAECKTGNKASDSKNLDSLAILADLLGGDFVTKLFVTDLSRSDKLKNDTNPSFDSVLAHTSQRNIRFVEREELPNIGNILREEAKTPKYQRG